MSYISLYRKYRPKTFSDVVGQEVVIKILKNSILTGKIGHAYIFSGPRGTGKTSIAKIFSKEGVIGRLIFYEIFKIDSMMIYINIVNILSLNLEKGYLCIYLPLILILVVSTFIAKLMYKNKEKLIIDCDKNN